MLYTTPQNMGRAYFLNGILRSRLHFVWVLTVGKLFQMGIRMPLIRRVQGDMLWRSDVQRLQNTWPVEDLYHYCYHAESGGC